jgi:hypothetical protein
LRHLKGHITQEALWSTEREKKNEKEKKTNEAGKRKKMEVTS